CHGGPGGEGSTNNARPLVKPASASSAGGATALIGLQGSDANGDALAFRVLRQPPHGRVGITGSTATYVPEPGFAGPDGFTITAYDGSIDAVPATITVNRAAESGLLGDGYPGTGGAVPAL